MSLSSKKSCRTYNRAEEKITALEVVAEETIYDPNPLDFQELCKESCCNPPLGDIYTNRLIYTLFMLRVISSEMLDRNMRW